MESVTNSILVINFFFADLVGIDFNFLIYYLFFGLESGSLRDSDLIV